jgi:hypothetical protein
MPTTDCASEDLQIETSALAPGETSKPLKSLFFGFAATVTVGLALGTWYVGVRIVAADEVGPTSGPSSAIPRAPVSATPAPTAAAASPAVSGDSMAQAYLLPPAVLYLQVEGLGSKQDKSFVRSLQSRGFRARVQALDEDESRILIGPFSTRPELELAQRKLQGAGVLAVETTH